VGKLSKHAPHRGAPDFHCGSAAQRIRFRLVTCFAIAKILHVAGKFRNFAERLIDTVAGHPTNLQLAHARALSISTPPFGANDQVPRWWLVVTPRDRSLFPRISARCPANCVPRMALMKRTFFRRPKSPAKRLRFFCHWHFFLNYFPRKGVFVWSRSASAREISENAIHPRQRTGENYAHADGRRFPLSRRKALLGFSARSDWLSTRITGCAPLSRREPRNVPGAAD